MATPINDYTDCVDMRRKDTVRMLKDYAFSLHIHKDENAADLVYRAADEIAYLRLRVDELERVEAAAPKPEK